MEKETINYEGTIFHALKGLPSYYGSRDGRVLSVKSKKPVLLAEHRQRETHVSYFLRVEGKPVALSQARVVYMLVNGVSYEQLGTARYTLLPDGRAVTVSLAEIAARMVRKRRAGKTNPTEWLATARRVLGMMERYHAGGDIGELSAEVYSYRGYIVSCLHKSIGIGREASEETASAAIEAVLTGISHGLVLLNIKEYALNTAKRMAKAAKRERKRLCGLTYDPADREYYEF